MINRDLATLAMINVSKGIASPQEKAIVEEMNERLFSDLYEELKGLTSDKDYAIEDYYEVEGDQEDEDDSDSMDLDFIEDENERIQFIDFMDEFGEDFDSIEEAYKEFKESVYEMDREYSDMDYNSELEPFIVDEFTEFLIENETFYSDAEEAYGDYIRNYCSYL